MLFSLTAISQTKVLQEQFGFYRIHEVQEFFQDTIYNEQGTIDKVQPTAEMVIMREGIDGRYNIEVTTAVYGNVNKTIDFLAKEPEYINYKVITK
jgi:hypothetical protein